ncbi:hypothetical protein AO1008_04095 [Aspergillus oryzae 100-8]|uniref:Chitin-binding type-2 domain-containing protein n=1 Tax=Aspergillus oryzae (strain 3.042) TaxID=1160506 RepID=I7ZR74_ASPO3|nr:hypothetical protein Ao3042_09687 [Aspergillus oryzae 3.042]KDE77842.1 hypothetical protein AO1008_04095 [Aspergillus oryzae 100-8]|eukprot:EIT74464.1 hypothetical protein Ao3042_09687 [Aspergillus oryzae 3.042]
MAGKAYWFSGDDPGMHFLCIPCKSRTCIEPRIYKSRIKMQFTSFKALAIFAASFFAFSAAAHPSCETGAVWADPHDCHSFFECAAGGIPVRKTCGPGTAYNSRFGICDYEEKVRSCHGHGPVGHDESSEGHGHQWKDHGNGQSEGHGQEGKKDSKGQSSEGHGQGTQEHGSGEQEHSEGSH